MSGLVGLIKWQGRVREEELRAMTGASPYRGPDGEGYYSYGEAGMACQAHWITPESVGKTQPLVHEATGVVLCADVRLDNRSELLGMIPGEDLSDSEIILALYLKDKEHWCDPLLGDFAIALWDPRDRTVQLTRDAMGMRGLYYYQAGPLIAWGTEASQILALPGIDKKLNEKAVAYYLSRMNLPREMSFFKGIHTVDPGERLILSERGLKKRNVWTMDFSRKIRYRREEEYGERFRELFLDAVKNRLRSRHPVGISLSGGVDSGCVASAVGWLYEQEKSPCTPEFRSYSWRFDQFPQCDERRVSRLITDPYRIPAIELLADENYPLKGFPDHGPRPDTPHFGVYQALLEGMVKRVAEDGVAVLLSGDRGDLLVGEEIFDMPGMLLNGHPGMLWKEAKLTCDYTGFSLGKVLRNSLIHPLASRLTAQMGRPVKTYYPLSNHHIKPFLRKDFLLNHLDPEYVPYSMKCPSPDKAVRDRFAGIFSEYQMRGMLWSENTNARFGVGFADVWSDRRLAEYVLSIPQYMVQRVQEQKHIAKQAMKGIMPEAALKAVGKVDPSALYVNAVREKAARTIRELSANMLSAQAGYVDEEEYRSKIDKVIDGEIPLFDLWGVLSLEIWLRQYWGS